jgi:hypothetical protein
MAPLASPAEESVDAEARSQIVDFVLLALKQGYVFPDKAEAMDRYVRQRLAEGAYDESAALPELTRLLTEDLQSVSHDKHLRVRPLPPAESESAGATSAVERRQRAFEDARQQNFGFHKLERLPGNVALLELHRFVDASMARDTAVAAMRVLATADALIIDLRDNGGGSPSMIQLISSYFFSEPVHLNSFHTRATDSLQELWTHEEVEGPRMVDTPLYVLISPRTFSAAEEFTYNLKHLGRATVIGETTGGGAHPVTERRLPALGVRLALPFGRAINPVTQTNWEGTGVTPHVAVPSSEALLVAHQQALQDLLHNESDANRRAELEWFLEHATVARQPIHLDSSALEIFVGDYSDRQVRRTEGGLSYQRPGDRIRRLVPLDARTFQVAGKPTQRLRFEGEAGEPPQALVWLSVDGRREVFSRR